MKRAALVVALLVLGATAVHAQTYTMTSPFLCDAAGYYPIPSFEGSVCRGVPLDDASGTPSGTAFIFNSLREGMALPNVPYNPYGSITQWDYSNSNSFRFEWEQTDSGGATHSGAAYGTWKDERVCSNRCWHHALLLTFSVTVNQ